MTRTDVALLCGGHASEHVISLKSGRTLLTALSAAGYGVHPVVIGEDARGGYDPEWMSERLST